MTRDDDDSPLTAELLSAWEVPAPPPAGELADAVIARMEATGDARTEATVNVPVGVPVDPREEPVSRRRRGLVIAGVAVACLAGGVGVYALVSSARPAGTTSGVVVADRARTLSLDGVVADLDPGADVRWHREGDILRVEQRAGAVAWRVAEDARVVIASRDAGATVASVEASGASLRMEVTMNATDARVLGASALTAAAVSMVTVTVYSGHVKLSGAQQPVVVVQAGESRRVTPAVTPEPPVVGASTPSASERDDLAPGFDPARDTIADVRIRAGETATVRTPVLPALVEIDGAVSGCTLVVDGERLSGPIATLDQGVYGYELTCGGITYDGDLTLELERGAPIPSQPPRNPIEADGRVYRIAYELWIPDVEVKGGTGELHVARGASQRTYATPVIPGSELADGTYQIWFSRDSVSTLTIERDWSLPDAYVAAPARWDDEVDIAGLAAPGTAITIAGVQVPVDAGRRFSARIAAPVSGSVVVRAEHPRSGIAYHVLRAPTAARRPVTVAVAGCDAAALIETGKQQVSRGQHAAALASFEAALRCKNSYEAATLAFIASCNSKNATKAAQHHRRLLAKDRTRLQPLCDRQGVGYDDLDEQVCLEAHRAAGREKIDQGAYAAALVELERALDCADDVEARRLAVVAACNAKDATRAQEHFDALSPADQRNYNQICIRNGISLAGASACDADALKDQGMRAINMGEHARALAHFEESLRCKSDPYVLQLAFMESCASGNSPKAKLYYKQLTPKQQDKFSQICERQSPPVPYTDDSPPASADVGTLQVRVRPAAQILVDGVLAAEGERALLRLAPGKHKITFKVGDDRFTYPVTIERGKTATMTKNLE